LKLILTLKYARKIKSGFGYRRDFPPDVRSGIGAVTFTKSLGKTESEAAKQWPSVNAEYERLVAIEKRKLSGQMSKHEIYQLGIERLRAMGFEPNPDDLQHTSDEECHEDEARRVAADEIIAAYPISTETGHPLQMDKVDEFVVRALAGGAPRPPEPTLADAVKLYKSEQISGSDLEIRKTSQRVDRVVTRIENALGRDPLITRVSRHDARKVRDHMLSLGTLKPSSVRRELNIVKAIFNHAKNELQLQGFENPFNKLPIAGSNEDPEGSLRDPLPTDVLNAVRARILNGAGSELRLIWQLLEGTGCRVAEITGLRRNDVTVDGETPNITVTWHESRRIKTLSSRRHVPLVGDALVAAKEALKLSKGKTMLFQEYGGENGPTNASAALMRHIRKVSKEERHVVHSLRHNMADKLQLAETPELTKNLILGHALGSVGNRHYGGDTAKLRVTTAAMRKAFELG